MNTELIVRLLSEYAQNIPYCEKIIISSTDGLVIKSYPEMYIEKNEALAASATSVLGLAHATSLSASKGTPEYALVRSQKGFMLIIGQECFSVFINAGQKANLGMLLLHGQKLSEKLVPLISPTFEAKKLEHPKIYARELDEAEEQKAEYCDTATVSPLGEAIPVCETQPFSPEWPPTVQEPQHHAPIEVVAAREIFCETSTPTPPAENPTACEASATASMEGPSQTVEANETKENEFCQININSPLGESTGVCESNYFKPAEEPVAIPQIVDENDPNVCEMPLDQIFTSEAEAPKVEDFVETRRVTPVYEKVVLEDHDEQERALLEHDSAELSQAMDAIQGEIKEVLESYNGGQMSVEDLESTIGRLEQRIIELTQDENKTTDEIAEDIAEEIAEAIRVQQPGQQVDVVAENISEDGPEAYESPDPFTTPIKDLLVSKPLFVSELVLHEVKKGYENPLDDAPHSDEVEPEPERKDSEEYPPADHDLFQGY